MNHRDRVLVSEVGPRDGLQNISAVLPLDRKNAWIAAEFAAGVTEIEVGSFVPRHVLPQLADTADVVRFARTLPGLTVAALVPNLQGALAAIEAGAHKITLPCSASETHNVRNLRRTHAQTLDDARAIRRALDRCPDGVRPRFEASVSTAFGCTLEGPIAEDLVVALAARLREAGADEIGLADTTGYANPAQLRTRVPRVRAEIGAEAFAGLHLHNTRGLGLANVVAGLEVGVRTFDSSLGGLGGCPFAPGASGNIVTEDLVYLLESMGFRTGIDLPNLLAVRGILRDALPAHEPLYGFVAEAGLPIGFDAAVEGER